MTWEQAQEQFAAAGLPLYETQYRQFSTYLEQLVETNRRMNLTAITAPTEIWAKHFLDSAVLLQKVSIPLHGTCLDVGTGAGFPGMVLAILRPDLHITLLDSLQKRLSFLQETAELLGLSNVCGIHGRAEDVAKLPEMREHFDFVTARAVATLPVLAEYCLPFVKINGVFAVMKGPTESAELGLHAVEQLGGVLIEEQSYTLDGVGARKLILVEKHIMTPPQYPRRGDKIKKHPL